MSDRFGLVFLIVLLVIATTYAYWPGLYGPFIFDDFANLTKLGDLGGVRDWSTFQAFVFNGFSGPSGRPIALFSFLLNAQDWPADPFWFKFTNLIIHLITGFLIFWVSKLILCTLDIYVEDSSKIQYAALVAASFWLLHPFLVSTTLYIVQRMAQLAAMFSLLAIATYLHGRSRLGSHSLAAYCWMSAAVVLGTLLATFSKENGVLLPTLILVLEGTIFASVNQPKPSPWWKFVFLVLPTALVVAYLGSRLFQGDPWQVSSNRGFSIIERLLTESRVLIIYLKSWFLPELYTGSVFHDEFPKSTGLLTPHTTLLAIVFNFIIIAGALCWRKRFPLVAFAVLFYYSGHLIESTTISLELYFEHRNYLPVAFLVLPVFSQVMRQSNRRLAVATSVFVLAILTTFTRYSTNIWSNYDNMVMAWAGESPHSVRAQQQASMVMYNRGRPDLAIRIVERFLENQPNNYYMWVWKVTLACKVRQLGPSDVTYIKALAANSVYDLRAINLHQQFVELIPSNSCREINAETAYQIIGGLLKNSSNANPRSARFSQIQYLLGRVGIYLNNIELAMSHFKNSLYSRPGPDAAMNIAAMLTSEGYYEQALEMSAMASFYIDNDRMGSTGQSSQSWRYNIEKFELQVRNEIATRIHSSTEGSD